MEHGSFILQKRGGLIGLKMKKICWNATGAFLKLGEIVKGLASLVRINSIEITGVDIRLLFSTGTTGGTFWNTDSNSLYVHQWTV